MDTKRRIDPAEALDTLFQIVRQEALGNPNFARRLLDAVGYTVEFRVLPVPGAPQPQPSTPAALLQSTFDLGSRSFTITVTK